MSAKVMTWQNVDYVFDVLITGGVSATFDSKVYTAFDGVWLFLGKSLIQVCFDLGKKYPVVSQIRGNLVSRFVL